jgi:hypothetical protein
MPYDRSCLWRCTPVETDLGGDDEMDLRENKQSPASPVIVRGTAKEPSGGGAEEAIPQKHQDHTPRVSASSVMPPIIFPVESFSLLEGATWWKVGNAGSMFLAQQRVLPMSGSVPRRRRGPAVFRGQDNIQRAQPSVA